MELPSLESIAIELTARCNQKCTYCYNAWRDDGGAAMGELEPGELLALVDRVLSQAKLRAVTLTGGEPFLRKDIHGVIDRINARGIPVRIISNGGAITEDNARSLSRQKIHYVQVTLAGPDAATHDEVCGKGSFDRIVRAITLLRAQEVVVGGSFLCTTGNWQRARELLERFWELGVRQIVFNRFNPSGYSVDAMMEMMPTRSMLVESLRQTHAFAGEHGIRISCTMPIPPCMIDEEEMPNMRFGRCAVGTPHAEYAVGPDGKLRLCTMQRNAIGDLARRSIGEILDDAEAERFRKEVPEFCTDCPHAPGCLGGCGASAEWVFGSARELDPVVARHVMRDFKARAGTNGRLPVLSPQTREFCHGS